MQTAVETPSDSEYDQLYKQYIVAQNERDDASRELQRLRDYKPTTASITDKKASGYQLYQLLLVAVAFLLLGAMLGKYERHHGIKLPLAQ